MTTFISAQATGVPDTVAATGVAAYAWLLILIPLASVLAHSLQLTANDYAKLITNSGIRNAFITSISCSVLAALVNCVFGFILAWVLVRYDFFGKRLLNGVIELPFALPTAVAGITLSKLYSDTGFFGSFFASYGIQIAYTKIGLTIAMFAAAMLALYVGFNIGLPRPYWAMSTALIVSHPLSGAVRSKAIYRLFGTLLGAAVAIFLVPPLVDSPVLLSLAVSMWIGACLFVSLLDRTPRSYLMMLAGYTAAIIAFPSVNSPGNIFDIAVARCEEISIGIVCATVVHSLIFPRPVGATLLARLDERHVQADFQFLRDHASSITHCRGCPACRAWVDTNSTFVAAISRV